MTRRNSRLGQFIHTPVHALCLVQDVYVRGVKVCTDWMLPAIAVSSLNVVPCGYSSGRGDNEDIGELIKAALQREAVCAERRASVKPKNPSMAMGRIDEGEICKFAEDMDTSLLFPGSQRSSILPAGQRREVAVSRKYMKKLTSKTRLFSL